MLHVGTFIIVVILLVMLLSYLISIYIGQIFLTLGEVLLTMIGILIYNKKAN